MRQLPLRKMAEDLAKHLAKVALTYRGWEDMTRKDRKLLIDIIYRNLQAVDELHRSVEKTTAA